MKKSVVVLLILSLVAAFAVAPAQAGKKKKKKKPVRVERVVEINYDHPGIGVAPVGGYPAGFPGSIVEGSTNIPTSANDQYIKIEVVDASGQKVWGFISQGDLNGDGAPTDGYAEFCGAHEETQPLAAPGTPIVGIYAYSGACEDGTPSVMTTGTIKITFSNMP